MTVHDAYCFDFEFEWRNSASLCPMSSTDAAKKEGVHPVDESPVDLKESILTKLKCAQCGNLYDLKGRKPRLLDCKHTFCEP